VLRGASKPHAGVLLYASETTRKAGTKACAGVQESGDSDRPGSSQPTVYLCSSCILPDDGDERQSKRTQWREDVEEAARGRDRGVA
jgi:hypothetical protein